MRKSHIAAVVLACVAVTAAADTAIAPERTAVETPRFWGALKPGPYRVGFRMERFAGGELHVWYPGSPTGATAMTFADYLRRSRDLVGGIGDFARDPAALRRTLAVAITGENGLDEALAQQILATPMAARRNLKPAAGRFPLVLWTHRYGTTAAQSVMSEYLASHGFVVVYPAEERPVPMPFALESAGQKRAELDRQVQRLRDALAAAQRLRFVRPERIGVLAWSYAGESAYLLQQREPSIALVAGLSSNVLAGWVYRPDGLTGVEPSSLAVPYLIISEPREAAGQQKLLQEAAAPTFLVSMPAMKHGAFNALEGMIPAAAGVSKVRSWSLAGPQAKLGYEVAAQYVRRALAHYLVAVPTRDTPFPLWGPDGDLPEGFATLQTAGTPRPSPPQPEFIPVEFESSDGLRVSADLYSTDPRAPTILLVHQSGASRGEYRQIAPRLKQMGFNALAIDNRWGRVDRWNGVENLTAQRHGTAAIVASGDRAKIRAIDRVSDLRAAVRWLAAQGFTGALLLWGSSITANGVLAVATEDPRVAAVLAFSPGEYDEQNKTAMQQQVQQLKAPVLIACGEDEHELCHEIYRAIPGEQKRFYIAARGRHGSSILLDDPANWKPVEEFLEAFRRRAAR